MAVPGRDAGRPVSAATLAGGLSGGGAGSRPRRAGRLHTLGHSFPTICSRRAPTSHRPGPASPQPPGDHREPHPRRHHVHRRHASRSTFCPGRGSSAGLSVRMRSALEVAEVIRRHGADPGPCRPFEPGQRHVSRQNKACHTAALGGHVSNATTRQVRIAYNSCRNRHCPKCRAGTGGVGERTGRPNCYRCPTSMWSSPCRRRSPRFLPEQVRRLRHPVQGGGQTLRLVAADPASRRRTRVRPVLHTWGRTCDRHPHFHCVVPVGGPSADGTR